MKSHTDLFSYSTIRHARDNKPQPVSIDWQSFMALLQQPVIRGSLPLQEYLEADRATRAKQKEGAAWIPAVFVENGLRRDSDVSSITAFVADIDNKDGDIVDASSIDELLSGLTYYAHTSYSHSAEHPKWRVVIPFSNPCNAEQFKLVFEHFQDLFNGALDRSCRNPSHLYYLPACPPEAENLYQYFSNKEALFEPESIEPISLGNIKQIPDGIKGDAACQSNAGNTAASAHFTISDELPDIDLDSLKLNNALRTLIKKGMALKFASRSEAVFSVVCRLVSKNIGDHIIEAILLNPKNGISTMPREKCRDNKDWLAADIQRAKEKVQVPLLQAKEVVSTALESLLENPGAAFEPDMLDALATIQTHDKSAYMNLRKEIKKARVPITKLEKELATIEVASFSDEAESNPQQSKAAEWISNSNSDYKYDMETDNWVKYYQGVWSVIESHEMQVKVQNAIKSDPLTFPEGYTATYASGVVTLLKGFMSFAGWNTDRNLVPFTNGVLNLDKKYLMPHSPNHRLSWCLSYDYDPTQHCKPIVDWMHETVKSEAIVQCLRAYLNAIVKGRSDLHRFMELIGPGGTGKSTFLKLAMSLVGEKNTATSELKHLENNRFEMANVFDKRLILITDAERYTGDVSMLKAITGGDPVRLERKYVQSNGHVVCNAMVLIASNESITSSEYTSGLYRRRMTIHFEHPVQLNKQRNLESEFAPYLSGLINWVLGMSDEDVTKTLKGSYSEKLLLSSQMKNLLDTNPLAAWLHSNVSYVPGEKSQIGVARKMKDSMEVTSYDHEDKWLYPNYVKFCEITNTKPVALQRFSRLLDDLCKHQLGLANIGLSKRTNQGRYFLGIIIPTFSQKRISPINAAFGLSVSSVL
jgi:phage/plasmid-associated DNA primase